MEHNEQSTGVDQVNYGSTDPQRAVRRLDSGSLPYRQPPLSPTELVVLRLLSTGHSERQAAEELDRSPNTVHVHIRNIYRKLGVNSRAMLMRFIEMKPGILEPVNLNQSAA